MTAAPSSFVIDEPLRPRWWWYLVAAIVAIGGIVFAIYDGVQGFQGISHKVSTGFARVAAPGEGTVHIDHAGSQSVFYEYKSTLDGEHFDAPKGVHFRLRVTDPDGNDVHLDNPTGEMTYTFNGNAGSRVFKFDAPEAGDYKVQSVLEPGESPDTRFVLAFGYLDVSRLVGTILSVVLPLIGGFVLALVIFLVTLIRRGRAESARSFTPPGVQPPFAG